MKAHCKGCKYHHSAGRTNPKPAEVKFNDWCTQTGMQASKSIGHCKLNNLKVTK